MPTPVYTSLTAANLVLLLAERVGDAIAQGTASSGTTTTIVDTNALSGLNKFDATDDAELVGCSAYIWAGTNIGAQRRISALNITTITATVSVAYASAIDSTSKYVCIRRWDGAGYLAALYTAQRLLTFDPVTSRGIMKELVNREIQLGNALINPMFDLYTTANAPDGWTTTNLTVTQETRVTYGGARRSLKVVTDGANVANLTQTLDEVGRYPSSFEVTAWVWCETASELFIRVNDGVDNHDSSKHTGTGWEKLKVTVTPSAVAGSGTDTFTVAIRSTTAASTITFYVQNVWFPIAPNSDHVYALDADVNLVVLRPQLRISGIFGTNGGAVGSFKTMVSPDAWEVVQEATRKIRLHISSAYNGCVVEYVGYKAHAALTAATTTWAGPIDAILDMAEAVLHKQKVGPMQTPSPRTAGAPELDGDIQAVRVRTLAKYGIRLPMGYRIVEPII